MKHLYMITFLSIITISTLHAADMIEEIKRAIERHNRERVLQLINNVDVNAKLTRNVCEDSLLHHAISHDDAIAIDLIEHGANVNVKNSWDMTPLHYAAFHNSLTVTQKLLTCGAIAAEKNLRGLTPADLAEETGHYEVAKLINCWNSDSLEIKEPDVD